MHTALVHLKNLLFPQTRELHFFHEWLPAPLIKKTHHFDQLGQLQFDLHSYWLTIVGHRTDEVVVVREQVVV